jgi:hypothetical protein
MTRLKTPFTIMDLVFQPVDLAVVDLDQVPQRLDPHEIGVGELHLVEELLPRRESDGAPWYDG